MKQFFVILGLTALVWLGVSISEEREFPLNVNVEILGYDTVKYAVLQSDTMLHLQVEMAGFNAAAVSLLNIKPTVSVEMNDEGLYRTVALADVADNLRQQLSPLGVRRVIGGRDSLRLQLAERSHRTYRVLIDSVDFSFSEQHGLYGEPRISPAYVTLYGADSVLASISELQVAHTVIDGISQSSTYVLPLAPVWKQIGDVRTTAKNVEVYVPVEAYVEREYTAPVEVIGADSTVRMRVYPDVVKVRVWVAKRDLERAPEFRVAIDYADVLAGKERMSPRLIQFPSWVRPRSVEPSEVHCVIIK
ncbi:MAG: hypothetical protein IKR33_07090 [Bacteroidales bacterium]|nr:hypothetical protein [Bacteroidales bacterium]